MALDPNIILQAGHVDTPDLGQLLQQRNAIRLGSLAVARQQQAQDALARVKADPTDMTALSDLAAVDAPAAQGYLAVQSAQRAMAARAIAGRLVSAYGRPGNPASVAPGGPAPATPTPADPNAATPAAPPVATPAETSGAAPAPTPNPAAQQRAATIQNVGAQQAATGDVDPAQAWGQLYALDPATGDQAMATIKGMDALRISRLAEENDAKAKAAQSLLSIPDTPDHGTRIAAAMRLLPTLAQHGVTQADIVGADLSDNGLHGMIGQALTLQGALDQANKDRDFTQKGQEMHKGVLQTVTNADGTTTSRLVDPMTGAVIGDGTAGAGGGASVPGSTALAGNNPGGIEDGAFAKSQPGYKGANGRFAVFDTLQNGVGAQTALLSSYVKRGFDTPAKIAARWAPAGDGPNNPAVYAANIARTMGIGVNDKISPAQINAFQRAQATQENAMYPTVSAGGGQGGGGGSTLKGDNGGGTGGLSPQGLDLAAIEYLKSGKMPTNVGRGGAAGRAVIDRAAQMAADQGLSLDDVVSGRAQWSASKAALNSAMKNFAGGGKGETVVRTLGVANDHLDVLSKAATALQNGDNRTFNQLGNAIATWSGKPAPTTFNALRDIVADEVVKAVTGTGGALGDRESLQGQFSSANSPQQLSQAIAGLKSLMGGQLRGFQREYEATTGRKDFAKFVSPSTAQALGMGGGNDASLPTFTPAQARGAPKGTRFRTTDGRVMVTQ